MGFDLALVTKEEIKNPEGKLSKFHFLVDRGFCTFIENAKNHSKPVIEELEKALQFNLQFLLKPEYYDPASFSEESLKEMGLTEKEIKESRSEPMKGFVQINSFLENLKKLQTRISEVPNYEAAMNYDRDWWLNYFGSDFQKDIHTLITFLEDIKKQGQEEFSFKI